MIKVNSKRFGTALLFGASLFLLQACSVALDWDPKGLPCDSSNECASGYSCLINKCISDGSLNEGDTCNDDFQCDGSLICGSNPFVCRKPCFDYFIDTIDCSFGEICKASPSRDGAWVGACIPSECAIDDDCPNAGEVCIKATESAGACLIGCEVSWSGGYYDDDCGKQSNQISYCQPLGNVKDALVCLDTSTDAGEEGDFCKAIDAPCRKGLACVEGMCRRYCDSENPVCGDVLACIGEPIDSGTIHICK